MLYCGFLLFIFSTCRFLRMGALRPLVDCAFDLCPAITAIIVLSHVTFPCTYGLIDGFFRLSLEQLNVIIAEAWGFGDANSLWGSFHTKRGSTILDSSDRLLGRLRPSGCTAVLFGTVCHAIPLAFVRRALVKGSSGGRHCCGSRTSLTLSYLALTIPCLDFWSSPG